MLSRPNKNKTVIKGFALLALALVAVALAFGGAQNASAGRLGDTSYGHSRNAPLVAPTPGDLMIYRVGDGGTGLSANAAAVFIDEYTTLGTFVQSFPMPTTAAGSNKRLVAAGNASSEGLLTRSTDGQYLLIPGYDAAVGTASIA